MKNRFLIVLLLFSIVNGFSQIVSIEYFFDTDPGLGNATALTVNSNNVIDQDFGIPTTGLSEGIHQLSIRVKKADNTWSLYDRKIFYINPDYSNTSQIAAAEYFFDTDPGVGNATTLTLNNSNVVNQNFSIPTTGLSEGIHQLNIRVKNSAGVWSLYDRKIFYINPDYSNASLITQMEYFFDVDPGIGNATPIDITDTADFDDDLVIQVPSDLPAGDHFLYIRVLNTDGTWSLYAKSEQVNTASITSTSLNGFKFYPNPVTEMLHFEWKNEPITELKIIDMQGKIIINSLPENNQLNVSELPIGTYLLQIQTAKGSISKKFIKK